MDCLRCSQEYVERSGFLEKKELLEKIGKIKKRFSESIDRKIPYVS